MFDKLREKWRLERELKERKEAAYDAIKSGSEQNVKEALEATRNDKLDSSDRGWCIKIAIDRQDLKIFREVMQFIDDPNQKISYEVERNNETYTYTYTPIDYALSTKRTHDISLWLANNPRTNITGSMLDDAKKGGMQDVAAVLAKRVAGLRRQEASQLDREAAGEGVTAIAVDVPKQGDDSALGAGESWALMSKTSIAHVTSSEAIGRKLTEIFNFDSHDRVQITENLKTGIETIGKPERFDALAPEASGFAEEMLKQLNAEAKHKSFKL